MRAQFIYEKFAQDSDPIRDLGIGSYKLLPKLILENDKKRMFFTCEITPTNLKIWIYHHSVTSQYGYYRKHAAKGKEFINRKIVKQYVEALLKKIGFEFLISYLDSDLNTKTVGYDVEPNINFRYNFGASIKRIIKYKRSKSSAGSDYIHIGEKNIVEV